MKKLGFIVLWALAIPITSSGQKQATYVKIAYEGGMFTHPGLSAGIERTLGSKKNAEDGPWNEFRWGGKLGFYFHRRYQTGVFVLPGISWVKTSSAGFQYGAGFHTGYLRSFIPNTYKVSEDGSVTRKRFFGTNHLALVPSFSLGKSLVKSNIPIEYFFNSQVMVQKPYFEGSNIYYVFSAGINYKL
jgi:hypothetical protein